MKYAILRTQKLKSGQAVRRSLTHAFREQDTPNADPSKTPDNTHIGPKDVDAALDRFNARLPDKVRKNAVLCIEYLVTGSPDAMKAMTRQQQDAYFADALKWLQVRHGAENVVYAGVHRDETTPHMYAYVVPLDERGKLNCRSFLGGAKALGEMQTDFAKRVGLAHGLERGLEGSKARHTTIGQYYGRVNAAMAPRTPEITIPDAKLLEGKEGYGKRVAQSVIDQVNPELIALRAKAAHTDLAQQQAQAAEQAMARSEAYAKQQAEALKREREKGAAEVQVLKERGRELVGVIANGGDKLVQLQAELRKQLDQNRQLQVKKSKGFER